MEFDVVIVGAGPAGLSAAIRLRQLAAEQDHEISVVVVDKGSEVGAHILSGAVIDPKAINELMPDWQDKGCPLETPVTQEKFLYMNAKGSFSLPVWAMPPMVKNHGCYIASLGNVCRWLAEQAEAMGVEIYPGMAASDLVYRDDGSVAGVIVGVNGIDQKGNKTDHYDPGMELRGRYVFIAEGARGSLAKRLISEFSLDAEKDPQKFGLGVKELWKVPDEKFHPGLVQHSFGWPLDNQTGGGSFCYHFGDNYVSLGFVTHLNYKNPYLSPYQEFQRFKTHPQISAMLEGGERIAYGARALTEGGFQSIPKLTFPGGVLIGCAAGFVNVPRIKGNHNAMKTGMMAAEAAFAALKAERRGDVLDEYSAAFEQSWVHDELYQVRNAKPLWSKFGTLLGGILFSGLDLWTNTIAKGFSLFGTLHHGKTDAASTEPANLHQPIDYPKPDGVLTFDRLTNVSFSGTNHAEDQPAHLHLKDKTIPIKTNLPEYGEPAQFYCPAAVYEVLYDEAGENPRFQINAQNCVHCKTCDIKDPSQNIDWQTPQGGDGPNYPNM